MFVFFFYHDWGFNCSSPPLGAGLQQTIVCNGKADKRNRIYTAGMTNTSVYVLIVGKRLVSEGKS